MELPELGHYCPDIRQRQTLTFFQPKKTPCLHKGDRAFRIGGHRADTHLDSLTSNESVPEDTGGVIVA